MDLGLHGRAFLVTGASSGLGLATAEVLVDEGASVLLVARRARVLEELENRLGPAVQTSAGDLSDPELPGRAVGATLAAFGRVDGALVSVGGPPPGGVLDTTEATWTAAFDSVFLPALRVAREVCAVTPDPRLAFVLSSSAKGPLARMAPSNGLRPGLAMLVKQLADEIGPRGGRAVGLLPGTVATDRISYLHGRGDDADAARAAAESAIPLRRMGQPAEFGRVAAFLLSDAASFVTGSMVAIDGGAMRQL